MFPSHEWPMWLRARQRAGRDMLAATLRVEERSLRRRTLDVLPQLLEEIRQARTAHPELEL